jgi:hypothetical protein
MVDMFRRSFIILLNKPNNKHALKSFFCEYAELRKVMEDVDIFVDKTKFIYDLECYVGSFKALWKPPGTGKSLLCEQLASYYDVAVLPHQVLILVLVIFNLIHNINTSSLIFLKLHLLVTTQH